MARVCVDDWTRGRVVLWVVGPTNLVLQLNWGAWSVAFGPRRRACGIWASITSTWTQRRRCQLLVIEAQTPHACLRGPNATFQAPEFSCKTAWVQRTPHNTLPPVSTFTSCQSPPTKGILLFLRLRTWGANATARTGTSHLAF